MFARIMNLLDDKMNFTIDEMKKYLEGYEYLTIKS